MGKLTEWIKEGTVPKPRKSTIWIGSNPSENITVTKSVTKVIRISPKPKVELQLIRKSAEISKHLDNIREILLNSNATPIRCRTGVGYACGFCREQYPIPAKLKWHTLSEHDNSKADYLKDKTINNLIAKLDITALTCTICNEAVENIDILLEHLTKHGRQVHRNIKSHIIPFKFDSEKFQCVICKKECNNFKVLLEHMNSHFRNNICEVCNTGFVNKRMLQIHSYRHKTGEFTCPICSKTFDTKVRMKEHERAVHILLNKRNKCSFCGERFNDYTKKNDHEVRVHGMKPIVLKCGACDKNFDNQRALTVHTKTYHLMEKRVAK